ncbi:hypothetical protein Tco_1169703, partial [Tanacetum coccineum]
VRVFIGGFCVVPFGRNLNGRDQAVTIKRSDQTGMYNRMGDDGVPCGFDFQAMLVYVLGIMRDDGTRSCMMWFIIGLRSTKRSVSRLFESWLEWMDAYFSWVKQGPFYDGYDDWKFYERYEARVTMTGANAEYISSTLLLLNHTGLSVITVSLRVKEVVIVSDMLVSSLTTILKATSKNQQQNGLSEASVIAISAVSTVAAITLMFFTALLYFRNRRSGFVRAGDGTSTYHSFSFSSRGQKRLLFLSEVQHKMTSDGKTS